MSSEKIVIVVFAIACAMTALNRVCNHRETMARIKAGDKPLTAAK